MKKLTIKEFIKRAKNTHGNRFDYSNSIYVNRRAKIEIICKKHGSFFQLPEAHITGQGCPECYKYTTEDFIKASNKIHGNKYIYDETIYKSQKEKVKISCIAHGDFLQFPTNHLAGNGCPDCVIAGFNKNDSAIVYYLKVYENDNIYYKIGITNRKVTDRFSSKEMKHIEVLRIWNFEYGKDAMIFEREILNEFKDFRCKGLNILVSGNTELFFKDVLQLDK